MKLNSNKHRSKRAREVGAFLGIGIAALLIVIALYFFSFVAKKISYHFWYEEQVNKTIDARVRENCLRN